MSALLRAVGPLVVCDRGGVVRLCSSSAGLLLGVEVGQVAGAVDDALLRHTPATHRQGSGPLTAALHGTVTPSTALALVTPAGDATEVLIDAGPLLDHTTAVIGAVLRLRTDHHAAPAPGSPLFGLHDPLTGLPNRRLLADRLEQAIARSRRDGSCFEVLMIDLDHFKQVNDQYGHEQGDRVLQEIGLRLVRTVRPGDTVARIGGDEFLAICEHVGPDRGGLTLADRLVAAASLPIQLGSAQVTIGASLGLTRAEHHIGFDGLLHQADLAMYEAKRRGRGQWVQFDPSLASTAQRRAHLASELRAAVDGGTVEVAYQPEVELQNGTIHGYEALVRWDHESLGQVPAQELVVVAEQTDLILALGALVLDRACKVAAGGQLPGPARLTMSVNLSARELTDPDLAGRVLRTLARHSLPGERLCLEITESNLIETTAQAASQLAQLRDAGISLSIDDFGTGFASLTYLQRLPVQQIKIDKSFVDGLPHSRSDDTIVTSLINLAHNLDLTVVAEGIESPAQAAYLRALGCDLGQGYLFGKPRMISDLAKV